MRKKTIAREVLIEGIGLHRGGHAALSVRPGEQGIVFLKQGKRIPAGPENVVDTMLNTTIGAEGVRISTIEHLMSALWGLSITDCELEVLGEEIPVADGSALPFVSALREAGIAELAGEVSPIRITGALRVEEGASWIEALPGRFGVSYEIEFPSRAIGRQVYMFGGEGYGEEIAPARTFGMLSDVEKMHSMGLALGGSLENAVVVDGDRVVNPDGLRFPDEFIRHKVLDLLGDLWTLGAPLEAGIRAYKASHRLHIALAKKIRDTLFMGRGSGS